MDSSSKPLNALLGGQVVYLHGLFGRATDLRRFSGIVNKAVGNVGLEHNCLPLPCHMGGPRIRNLRGGVKSFADLIAKRIPRDRPTILVGHSLGGVLSCHVAALMAESGAKENLKGIVLLDIMPPELYPENALGSRGLRRNGNRAYSINRLLHVLSFVEIVTDALRALRISAPMRETLDNILSTVSSGWSALLPPEKRYILRGYSKEAGMDFSPKILRKLMIKHRPDRQPMADLEIPMLIIKCTDSNFVDSDRLARYARNRKGVTTCEVAGDHWIMADRDATREVAEVVAAWMADL